MYAAVRRQKILGLVESQGTVNVEDLAEQFDISRAAIRRDLNELARAGHLERTYGGAVKINIEAETAPYEKRLVLHAGEKRLIGAAAAAHVSPGETVFVDCGTTTEILTEYLREKPQRTLVTPCLRILNRVADCDHITVVAIRGVLDHQHQTLGGALGPDFLSYHNIRFDKAFISAGGVSIEQGITSARLGELPVKKRAIELANESILVADASKIGKYGVGILGPIRLIDRLITGRSALAETVEAIRTLGVVVELV
ncbi:MAG: DeoR/GlpR family DNA-binding transcription regulator [Anaerolineae bacterium]|nr:DeoR/GlpR family DNA-binding transcription regulator [Anaerolineae bacterium]